jgi:hypothetical protein
VNGRTTASCAKLGSTKIGIAQLDATGISNLLAYSYAGIQPFGLTKANTSVTLIPATAVDLSSYAAALVQKSTCIVMVLAPNQQVPLAAAIHAIDPNIPVMAVGGTATPAQWQTIGSRANNVYDNTPFPPASDTAAPGMAQYNSEVDAYSQKPSKDPHSVAAWSGVHLIAKFLTGMTDPSGAKLIDALNNAGTINIAPLPPLNFKNPSTLVPNVTRAFTSSLIFFHYVDGGKIEPFYNSAYVPLLELKSQPPFPNAPALK